jgi:phytoene dehydrogenase-like protein
MQIFGGSTVPDVIIVGGGIAGLTAARILQDSEADWLLVEAADEVGGRIRTDVVDGFRLDRGFQVLLTAYPEAKALLNYEDLQLSRFEPGALIRLNNGFTRFVDPVRRPLTAVSSACSAAATLRDKLLTVLMKRRSQRMPLDEIFERDEQRSIEWLSDFGFSSRITERFFRPFFGGVFLDPHLETSTRMLDFTFSMFNRGAAAIPALGMQEIPRQMASHLPPDRIHRNSPVASIDGTDVILASGDRMTAQSVILAVEEPAAARLLSEIPVPESQRSVQCVYFNCSTPPMNEPMLVLNGTGSGPVNNLCVPSLVSPDYAPEGQHLVSATVLGGYADDSASLESLIGEQMRQWFGNSADDWQHLRTYDIHYALPDQSPGRQAARGKTTRLRDDLIVCGDFCEHGSIQGAMQSGRRAAGLVLESN